MGHGWNNVTAIVTPGDVTGGGKADVLGRDTAGRLWLYPGNGAGGLLSRRQIGQGWNGMDLITNAADMTGDGRPDVLARNSAGVLWLYPLSGNAKFGNRIRISSGWQHFDIMGPGDVSGDRRADILAREPDGQVLRLYRGNGVGGIIGNVPVSTGWHVMNALVTPGNWDRAAGNDLLTRDLRGRLWLNPGDNAGGFGPRRQIGHGWNGMTYIG